ncbi:MAG: ABC transporter ATP-binding protein [Alphaproteobacteria bacterium]|nr:ABC transporter ATP-binding protein [Alphaproteobacteria bacterium]
MLDQLRTLFADIRERLGAILWVLIVLQALTGLMEGLAVASILPLLGLVGIGSVESGNPVVGAIRGAAEMFGLPFSYSVVGAFIVLVFAVNYGVFVTQAALSAKLYSRYGTGWQNELFRTIVEARWRFFVRHRGGDLMNGLTGEVTRVTGAFYQFTLFAAASVTAAIYVVIALALSWQVTLLILSVGALLFAVTRPLVKRAYRVGNDVSRDNAEVQALGAQFIGGAKLLKATATEAVAVRMVSPVIDRLRRSTFFSLFDGQLIRSIFEFGGVVMLVALLVVGVQVIGIDAGIVLVVLVLFVRLFPKLSSLQQSLQAINVLAPAVSTLRALRKAAGDDREESAIEQGKGARGGPAALTFAGVCVDHGAGLVLRDIDLVIQPGEILALVGGSGAGKSTLVDCLLRLTEPTGGVIRIDGEPLSALPLRSWRRSVGYLSQDSVLFNASIAENIAWGLGQVDRPTIESAARRASVHDFIVGLPQTYDTRVGDRGVRLSGGERQRIALARALIGNPRLLVLDEATSALDAETERAVTDTIAPLKGSVTIVLVAHRLSTCRVADRIVVLEAGRIQEVGTMTELLAARGRFHQLWSLQTEGVLPEVTPV